MKKWKWIVFINIIFVIIFIVILWWLFMPYYINKKIGKLLDNYPWMLLKMYIYENTNAIKELNVIKNHKGREYKDKLSNIIIKYPIIIPRKNILNVNDFMYEKVSKFIDIKRTTKTKDWKIVIWLKNNKWIISNLNFYKSKNLSKLGLKEKELHRSFCFVKDLDKTLFLQKINNKKFNYNIMNILANISWYNNIAKYLWLQKDICVSISDDWYILLYKK